MNPKDQIKDVQQVITYLLSGLRNATLQWFKEANLPKPEIIIAIENVLKELDRLWAKERIPLTTIYLAARIIEEVIEDFENENGEDAAKVGTIVLGTMNEDFHSLGKNLVKRMIRPFFYVHDLGVNVPVRRYIEAATEHNADIIAVSALMMNSVLQLNELREAIDSENWEKRPKLVVGGAPFALDEELYKFTGADAYAPNAIVVAERCIAIIEETNNEPDGTYSNSHAVR